MTNQQRINEIDGIEAKAYAIAHEYQMKLREIGLDPDAEIAITYVQDAMTYLDNERDELIDEEHDIELAIERKHQDELRTRWEE